VSTVEEAQKVRLPPPKNSPMKNVAADHGYVTSTLTGIVAGGLLAGGAVVVATGHALEVTLLSLYVTETLMLAPSSCWAWGRTALDLIADGAAVGHERRLEHVRPGQIPARNGERQLGSKREPAAALVVEDRGENGRGIEVRQRQPLDRAVARNQRDGAPVPERPVVTDRRITVEPLRHHRRSLCLTSRRAITIVPLRKPRAPQRRRHCQ
jgi:hypothetical protein